MPKITARHQFEEKWRKLFEKFATNSEDDAGIAGWSATGLATRLRNFSQIWRNHTEFQKQSLWLDLGCGAGTYSKFISDQGMQVIGLDYSFPTLTKAQLRGYSSIAWCVADATKVPLRSNSFDGAICFGVTQALENSRTVVSELALVTKEGGKVWIDALNRWCIIHVGECLLRWLQRKPRHLRYETPHNIMKLMRANHLGNIQLYWLPMLPSKLNRFQWILETPFAKWIFQKIPLMGSIFCHAFIITAEKVLPSDQQAMTATAQQP